MIESKAAGPESGDKKSPWSILRDKIKRSIYGQEHSDKNVASRWAAEKLSTPEELKQDEAVNQLENMAQALDDLWGDPQQQDKMTRDDYSWGQRGHQGNYQKLEFDYKGVDQRVNLASWRGVIDETTHWGDLNRVDGYIGAGEIGGDGYSSAAYFSFDVEKPLVGPNSERRMAEITFMGGQLLPEVLRDHNIDEVRIRSYGLETFVSQFDQRLDFENMKVSVGYTAGTKVENKHFPDKQVGASPHGPIHEVKISVDHTHDLKMHLSADGQWVPVKTDNEWLKSVTLSGETLENGDVRVKMTVHDETKEIVLHKVDLDSILETSQHLVKAITETSQSLDETMEFDDTTEKIARE